MPLSVVRLLTGEFVSVLQKQKIIGTLPEIIPVGHEDHHGGIMNTPISKYFYWTLSNDVCDLPANTEFSNFCMMLPKLNINGIPIPATINDQGVYTMIDSEWKELENQNNKWILNLPQIPIEACHANDNIT